MDLKVRAATAFCRFNQPEARQWADLLSYADDKERHLLTIAEFHWHRAAWFCERGDFKSAGISVKEAATVCPEIRGLMNDDPRLDRLLFG